MDLVRTLEWVAEGLAGLRETAGDQRVRRELEDLEEEVREVLAHMDDDADEVERGWGPEEDEWRLRNRAEAAHASK